MNEDYLWDKTGEPDPEIELLEQKLTSLRFKRPAEPLPLPAAATPPRYFFRLGLERPALAAAAALVALLLAAGLWLGLRQSGTAADQNALAGGAAGQQQQQAALEESGPPRPADPQPAPYAVSVPEPKVLATIPQPRTQKRSSGARQLIVRRPASQPGREELARRGEEAKAQLIKALHIAGDKLNEVQKKIRGGQEQRPTS